MKSEKIQAMEIQKMKNWSKVTTLLVFWASENQVQNLHIHEVLFNNYPAAPSAELVKQQPHLLSCSDESIAQGNGIPCNIVPGFEEREICFQHKSPHKVLQIQIQVHVKL
jgi:hypothetical protein